MIQFTKAMAWRLRVNLVCRQAAKQFVRQNPTLKTNVRYLRVVSAEISERADKLSEYIRLTYPRADQTRVQQARDLFTTHVWNSIHRGR